MTDDFHYLYVFAIANLAALDSSQAEWDKAKAAMGADRWAALERRGSDATNPRLKADEQKYVRLDFYYLVPGKQAEAEAADECVNAILGTDVLPLQARATAITRRFDRRTAVSRPDLSRMVIAALQ